MDGGNALEETAAILKRAHAGLKVQVEGILDRRTRSLLQSQDGSAPELRKTLYRARKAARMDLLIGVSRKGFQAARFISSSDGLSVRVRLEEDPRARALVEALAFGGVRPPDQPSNESKVGPPPKAAPDLLEGVVFAALPEAFFQELVADPIEVEEDPEQPVLVILHAEPAGSGAVLLGGIRLSTLGEAIQKVLDEKWGPQGPRWSAFLAGKPAGGKEPSSARLEPRIVAGDGEGFTLPEELASLILKEGRVVERDPGRSRRVSAAWRGTSREEWMVLHDRDGGALGGIGVRFQPAVLSDEEAPAGEETEEAGRPEAWEAAAGVFGGLIGLASAAFLLLRRKRWKRRSRRRARALAQAREELSGELKVAAKKFSDPVFMGPVLERAFEKAVGKSGENLACAIGEQIAESISSRIPRAEEIAKLHAAPPGEESEVSVVTRAVLGESFPIALLAVDANLEVVAWNPAAERLWDAQAEDRLGRSLEEMDFFGLEGEMRGRARRSLETGVVEPPIRLSFDNDRVRHIQLTVIPLIPGVRPETALPGGPAAGADAPAPPPEGALLIAENVSEKIEHEIAAKVLGQYQKALSASLPLPMVVVDAEGRVMSWNAAAENLFGVPEREALGKEFSSIPPTSVEQSALPFCTPDGTQKGTLYLFGKAARALDPPELEPVKEEPAKGEPAKAQPAAAGAGK